MPQATVSLVKYFSDKPNTFLKLHQNFKIGEQTKYTVCLGRALYGDIDPSLFVEWVEANRIFGADKFLFHVMNMPDKLVPYMEFYKDQGIFDVIPWEFPWNKTLLDIVAHTDLQHMLISDCQYRLQTYSR